LSVSSCEIKEIFSIISFEFCAPKPTVRLPHWIRNAQLPQRSNQSEHSEPLPAVEFVQKYYWRRVLQMLCCSQMATLDGIRSVFYKFTNKNEKNGRRGGSKPERSMLFFELIHWMQSSGISSCNYKIIASNYFLLFALYQRYYIRIWPRQMLWSLHALSVQSKYNLMLLSLIMLCFQITPVWLLSSLEWNLTGGGQRMELSITRIYFYSLNSNRYYPPHTHAHTHIHSTHTQHTYTQCTHSTHPAHAQHTHPYHIFSYIYQICS
jgi:hypothetical protein